ncbi:MAG TPA: type II CAAX endopeptidase family protein [Candidatus Kapabacteria bacterium]|mgnify:FL=1|nr:type II CAAX endopeptidase family protein [Candidatus Kapabacteria bacterium]HRT67348.1 type II CAAX endopeptidase family protein [Bacteroidota bacterium]
MKNKALYIGYGIATVCWFLMFSPWTKQYFNFWIMMMIASGTLSIIALTNTPKKELKQLYKFNFKNIAYGVLSFVVLYGVFYIGNIITRSIFNFAPHQIENVYATKTQADSILIGLALLFWIGPSEEIFWRAFAQNSLSKKLSPVNAYLINTFIYTFIHIWSFNFILILAAAVAGLAWGWLFMKYRSGSMIVISHALWDLFAFVIIPFV